MTARPLSNTTWGEKIGVAVSVVVIGLGIVLLMAVLVHIAPALREFLH